MRNKLIEWFQMPPKTIFNRKIAKKQFYEQGQLTTNEKELLTSEIESIYLLSICRQDTVNIPKLVNEDVRYEEVYWLAVFFKPTKKFEQILKLFHKVLPNPIVIIAVDESENVSISTAHKRLNQNDQSKVVIDHLIQSPWCQLDSDHQAAQRFLERIYFDNLSFRNLYDFYDSVHAAVIMSSLIETIDNYPKKSVDADNVLPFIEMLQQLDETIKIFDQSKQEHPAFGQKMNLHIKIKQQQQQREKLLQQVKEFC